MCGIAGFIAGSSDEIRGALVRAHGVLRHRGPNGSRTQITQVGACHIGLLHERLAIIDLTNGGSQPRQSANGRHWICYNGEIYNYIEIRSELKSLGREFTSTSDTEVLLAALETWGEAAMSRFNGMWAFAWLDIPNQRLVLSRDRMGVKPLYYRRSSAGFAFASEIKALLEMVQEPAELNLRVVGAYVQQSLLDVSPDTFFSSVAKVEAGTYVVIDLTNDRPIPVTHRFWAPGVSESSASLKESADSVRELLIDSVRIRLRSDVPIGVLLSGGVDSSAIAGCMHALLGRSADLNLISAVSDGSRFDEAPFIDRVAAFLGRSPRKVIIDSEPSNALSLLEDVCWYNDEPVGSFGNVAQFLLMKRAKELDVTVVLSGQGADEIFCGYKKFVGFYLIDLMRQGRLLEAMRAGLAFLWRGALTHQITMQELKRYLPARMLANQSSVLGEALADYAPELVGLATTESFRDRQIQDVTRFSIPILTHYEDRMSMAWGREIRNPFLDYRLVEAALALPASTKLAAGWTKWVLREAMRDLIPPEIAWRRDKMYFTTPHGEWLKRELRPAVLDLLSGDSRIFDLGLYNRGRVTALYERYCKQSTSGGSVSFKEIFQPLALEVWLKRYQPYLSSSVRQSAEAYTNSAAGLRAPELAE